MTPYLAACYSYQRFLDIAARSIEPFGSDACPLPARTRIRL